MIRLETSANKAQVKKLPEMMYQILYGHECFMSHSTTTLHCGFPFRAFTRAQENVRRKLKNEAPLKDDDEFQYAYNETVEDELPRDVGADDVVPLTTRSNFDALVAPQRETDPEEIPDGDEEAAEDAPCDEDFGAGAHMEIKPSDNARPFDNWLLRGEREPLRSMGMYHYAMYVYRRFEKDATEDFAS